MLLDKYDPTIATTNITGSIIAPRSGLPHSNPEIVSASVPPSVEDAHNDTDATVSSLGEDHEVAIRCDFSGCKNKGTFKSSYELIRHMKAQHGDKRFRCDAQGCYKGQLPWSFARPDKLTSHIKAVHGCKTNFARCPADRCKFGPCALDVLGVHLQHQHPDHEHGRAILNATPCKTLKCPLWRCGKYVTSKKLLDHLSGHTKADIEAAKQSLESESLLVEFTASGDRSHIHVLCPVCNTINVSVEQFVRHLSSEHLYAPRSGGSEHFEKWKACLAQNLEKIMCRTRYFNKILPWSSFKVHTLLAKRDFCCPFCPFSVAGVGRDGPDQRNKERAIEEHHLSFLRPEAEVVRELYPYRMQILRLWPEFVTHPVFADFDQPQHQSEGGPSETQASSRSHVNDGYEFPDGPAHGLLAHSVLADFDQSQQRSRGGPSERQPPFANQVNDDFEIPDWATYDFNTPM
jgi:hypothetical protein